jgi:hypothetical protein
VRDGFGGRTDLPKRSGFAKGAAHVRERTHQNATVSQLLSTSWLDRVEHTAAPQGSPRSALAAAVDALRVEPGREQLVALEGRAPDGRPMFAIADLTIKKLDHILMDTHFAITVAYEAGPDGMCSPGLLDELNAMEDELLAALGPDAVFIAHETGLGHRLIHLHATSDGPVPTAIERWERRYMNREIETVARADPQWDILRRW